LSSDLDISVESPQMVKITYGNGDLVEGNTPRQVDIYISCDPSAQVLTFSQFLVPNPSNPPPPYYLYQLNLTSSQLCPPITNCMADDFTFDVISSINTYKTTWTPPFGGPQTLTYAPCSRGTFAGCGTDPIFSQCYNQSNCCAVCQSWMEDTGPAGACLGLSENLLGVTVITPVTVKITYGAGDMVEITPRQVDVYISCDPAAGILTFVKFIPPTPQNPPPPYYLFQIFFSSSTLCDTNSDNNHISAFLSSLGINYP